MSLKFSTEALDPKDRISYWVDVASKAFFAHDMRAVDGFDGLLQYDQLGSIGISTCVCGPYHITRTRQDIARDGVEDYILGIRLEGRTIVSQGDVTTKFEPGSLILLDTGRPFVADHLDPTRTLYLMLPRKEMLARLGERSLSRARHVSERMPVAGVMSDFLKGLARRVDKLEIDTRGRFGEQAVDLIAMGFAEGQGEAGRFSPRAATLSRLKAGIDSRLTDHTFRPKDAAMDAGISVRYANALLAEEGSSLERYILQRRLERCRAALRDPFQRHRQIGDIALSWGFSDHSHFTRRFRDAFGMTPGECRKLAAQASAQ
jgi:AraC-like DNA-binding protein